MMRSTSILFISISYILYYLILHHNILSRAFMSCHVTSKYLFYEQEINIIASRKKYLVRSIWGSYITPHLFICSLIYLIIYLFIYLYIYLFIYLFIHFSLFNHFHIYFLICLHFSFIFFIFFFLNFSGALFLRSQHLFV